MPLNGVDLNGNATMTLPSWLWGDKPRRYLQMAELRHRAIDKARGLWSIETYEHYRRSTVDMVNLTVVATNYMQRFDILNSAPEGPAPDQMPSYEPQIQQLLANNPGDLTVLLSAMRLRTQATQQLDKLPEVVEDGWQGLRAVTFSDGGSPFPDSQVFVIRTRQTFHWRMALPRVLLRRDFDPNANLAQRLAPNYGKLSFASATGLGSGRYLQDTYFAPLALSLSPYVWMNPAYTGRQIIVYDFGRAIIGQEGRPVERLQLFTGPGVLSVHSNPDVTPLNTLSATRWWTERLSDFYYVISNPALHVNRAGEYDPDRHLHASLTVEQLFRHCQAILTSHRDVHTRKSLLFSFLDGLHKVSGIDLTAATHLTRVDKIVTEIRDRMPSDAAPVLLPNIERARDALSAMQGGFFMGVDRTRSSIDLYRADGRIHQTLPLEAATAHLLRTLRDATHGYGGRQSARNIRDNALLVQHDGDLPDELGLLAYLYLVYLIAYPERVAKYLGAG